MIYDTLSKGEDGLYHSRALNDEKKRHFIQLNGVSVSDVDQETGEVSFEVTGCLLYTSPSPRDRTRSRMPSSA